MAAKTDSCAAGQARNCRRSQPHVPSRAPHGPTTTLEPQTLLLIVATSLIAFGVRGLSGFGSSMIGIGTLSLLLPPTQVVPAFLALELLTTLHLLPSIWRQVDWRSLRWVLPASALGTPFGLMLLASLDPDPMRLLVSACLMATALLMLSGHAQRLIPPGPPGAAAAAGAGLVSGVLNGAAGIGGPPVVLFYFSSFTAATSRATLIAYFLVADVLVLIGAGGTGLLASSSLRLIGVALVPALVGIWCGQRLYGRLDDTQLKRTIWRLLGVLGAFGVGLAMWRLMSH